MGVPLYVTLGFSFAAFRILSLTFAILIFGVGIIGFILFGTLCDSCTWLSVSFFRFRKFYAIISSNTFLTPLSLSYPSGTPIIQMLVCLMFFQRSLKQFLFFNLFFFLLHGWVICISLSFRSLMDSSISPNLLLIPSSVFFISVIVFFSSVLSFFYIFF